MDYDIIYSDRRTLGLTIKDGRLVVRAPYGIKQRDIEEAIDRHRKWINDKIDKQRRDISQISSLTASGIALLKKQAKEYFTVKTDEYAKLMGLKYGRITITSAMKRFGSCNSYGNICFSYRLMLYPECAREYVIVHELAHLKEMNHSVRFYSIVEAVMPDYKVRRKYLSTIKYTG